jgi:ubiquinone/menaquinone biosynthesis C-methylase UbiE
MQLDRSELRRSELASNTDFKLMAFFMKARDVFRPRRIVLEEAHIQSGFHVLDYGCGAGSYIPDASRRVGETGRVYALDMHPMSIQRVAALAKAQRLANVRTILSECQTGLPDESVDVALLYDVFHALAEPQDILGELHRVLKRSGHLSFSDHHMKHSQIIEGVTQSGLFRLSAQGDHTYDFVSCA